MTRAIITVVGKDNVGIIARICTHLADNSINILDISQTMDKILEAVYAVRNIKEEI